MRAPLPVVLVFALACEPILVEEAAGKHPKKDDCATCHMNDYRGVRDPVHVGAKPTACEVCHAQTAWHPSVLNHEWPLTGKHEKTTCFDCHKGTPAVFRGTKKACVSCHQKELDEQNAREEWHAKLGTSCADCHTTNAFAPANEEARRREKDLEKEEEDAADAGDAPDAASATTPTTTPSATTTAATKPRPTATSKPKPKPTATGTATQVPTVVPTVPDPVTGASRRAPRGTAK